MITLRPDQMELVEAARDALKGSQAVLARAPCGAGKCLGKDTPILMFDGKIKLAQNIIVGDKIMGHDSDPRIVTSICSGS